MPLHKGRALDNLIFPDRINRYTVIFETRMRSATSKAVRNRGPLGEGDLATVLLPLKAKAW